MMGPFVEAPGGIAGPFLAGETVRISCRAFGGDPAPTVAWYDGGRRLPQQTEVRWGRILLVH